MITCLSALLLFSTGTQKTPCGSEFLVRATREVPIERLADAVRPIGKIESRKQGTSLFLIRLKPGSSDGAAKRRLAALSGVHVLSTGEEQVVLRAVRSQGEPISGIGDDDGEENQPSGGVVAIHKGSQVEFRKIVSAPKRALGKDQAPATDSPDEATRWRRLALVDEHGVIPPNALQIAIDRKREMAEAAKPMSSGPGWTEEGPSNFSGRSRCVVIDPTNPLRLWMGAVGGGIWRSLDGGKTWTAVGDSLPSLAVCTLVLDPNDNKTLYAGTGEGYFNGDSIAGQGIFKSVDGGTTWQQLPGSAGWGWTHINRIAVCPGNSNLILVTQQYGGVFRSTDGGQTFSNPFWAQSGHAVAFCPTNPNRVIGTIQDYDFSSSQWYAAAIYSTDGGASWTKASGPLNSISGFSRIETCPVPSDQNTVFASASDGNVYKSTDGGQSYSQVNTNGSTSANWYANCIWVDPTNSNRLVITGTYVYGSTDGGATINEIGAGYIQTEQPHPDVHFVTAAPGYDGVNNKTVYVCTDGGLYTTSDITTASLSSGWSRLDQGARSTQYYSVAGDGPTNFFVGGLQDNGSEANQVGNGQAFCFFGGDGGYVAIDPTNPLYVYGEYIDLELFRNNDGATGGNSGWIYGGIADAGNNANFIAPFILDPNQPQTLLAGGASLWRSTDSRDSNPAWSAIRTPGSSLISAIAVANGNSDVIWVGQNDGGIAMTTNGTSGSPTWNTISTPSAGPIPGRYVTRILLDPENPNTVYVTLGGFSADNVWKSTDAGTTWNAITGSGAGTLPQVPVRAIARRPGAPNTLYIGTEIGIFSTFDGGNNWTTVSDMGINVSVDDLEYMNNSGTLLAATHGRGIWALPFGSGILNGLSLNPVTVLSGGTSAGTITLNNPAGTGGAIVNLTSNSTSATVPATVTIPAGEASATFTVTTTGVASLTQVTITAALGSKTLTANLTINPPTLTGLSISPTSVIGGTPATGTVTTQGVAGPKGLSIGLSSTSQSVSVPSSVTIGAGASTATFNLTTTPVAASTTATIKASSGSVSQTATLNVVSPVLAGFTLSPTNLVGGSPTIGTLTLSGPAPTGGIVVSMTSTGGAIAPAPQTVTIPAGTSSATFTISTAGVFQTISVAVTASVGAITKTASLTITPATLSNLTITPSTVTGGTTATGTIALSGSAPPSGLSIAISSNVSSATVPQFASIAGGASAGSFTISTSAVSNQVTATITGTLNGRSSAGTLNILTPLLSGVSVSPASVVGGNTSTGTVVLARPAPSGGASIALASTAGAVVPSAVTIAAGATSTTFSVTTLGQSSTIVSTISASLAGTTQKTTLTINPASLVKFSISPSSIAGGNTAVGTVTLSGVAPSLGLQIALKSSNSSALIPGSVSIASGNSTATFSILTSAVTTQTNATISATLGTTTLSSSLAIQPSTLAAVTLSPAAVVGGSSAQVSGVVMLTGLSTSAGATVSLSSSNTTLATVPASVKIAGGMGSASFVVSHKITTTQKAVTITATYAGVKQTAILTLNPFQVVSLNFSPSSVAGGMKTTGSVQLNAQPASSGAIVVKLSSDSKALPVPSTVSVPIGQTGASFAATPVAVTSSTTATVTATYGAGSQTASVTVLPSGLAAISVSPQTVKGGSSTVVTGTVTLTGFAPTGGLVINLTSSNLSAAKMPATVTVAAGKSSATFKVTDLKVNSQVSVTLTATAGGITKTTTLVVTP